MHRLGPARVGQPEHGRLHDRRVGVEHLLDLAGKDIQTAGLDHVLDAVDDVDEAVLIDAHLVAGAKPWPQHGLRAGLGVAPVAAGDLVAAQQQLALPRPPLRLALRIEPGHLYGLTGQTHRAMQATGHVVGQQKSDRAGQLGQAVDIADDLAKQIAGLDIGGLGEHRAGHGQQTQAADIARLLLLNLDQLIEQGRNQIERGDAMRRPAGSRLRCTRPHATWAGRSDGGRRGGCPTARCWSQTRSASSDG